MVRNEFSKRTELCRLDLPLAPDAVDDYSPPIELAERAVKAGSDLANQGCLGAVLYRAGRFDEAMKTLQGIAESEKPEKTSPAYGWHFLAMAHHAVGDSEKANQGLNKAVQWTDRVFHQAQEDGRHTDEPGADREETPKDE